MWRLLTVPMRGMSHCPGPCPLKVEEGYSLFDLWTGLLCKWGRQKREKVTETLCTWGVMWPQQLWRIFIPGESMKWGSCPVTKPGKHRLMLFLSTLQQLVGSHECQFVAMHNNNNNNNNNNKTMTKQWQKTNKKTKHATTIFGHVWNQHEIFLPNVSIRRLLQTTTVCSLVPMPSSPVFTFRLRSQ